MNVGPNIQKCRKQKGLTQKELAELCQVATGTIQQYELGKRQPRIEQLQKIADVLGVSYTTLMGIDSSETRKIKTFTADLLESNPELNKNLCFITSKYVKDELFEKLTTQEKAKLYNELYAFIEYDSDLKEIVVHPRIPEPPAPLTISYNKLNKLGKLEAIKRVQELTELEIYTKKDEE